MEKWCREFIFRNIKVLGGIYGVALVIFLIGGLFAKNSAFLENFYGVEIVGIVVSTPFVAIDFLQNILFLKMNNVTRREILKGYARYISFLVFVNLTMTLIFKWLFGYESIFEMVNGVGGFKNIIYIISLTILSLLMGKVLMYLAYRGNGSGLSAILFIIGIFLSSILMQEVIIKGLINRGNILFVLAGGAIAIIIIFIEIIKKFKVEGGYEI